MNHLPLLLRSPGYHTGANFILSRTPPNNPAAAACRPDLLVIEYLDARGSDGSARKFRVMMIGEKSIRCIWRYRGLEGALFHLRHGRQAASSLEKPRFSPICRRCSATGCRALEGIRDALGLDYAGIDFA